MRTLRRIVCGWVLVCAATGVEAQRTPAEVRQVFADRRSESYADAADDFVALVSQVGQEGVPPGLERSLAQLALVLPDSLARRVRGSADRALGAALEAWWRRQDPLPATSANERAVEHLLRVAAAEEAFGADTPTGLDARGETFVRFGMPTRRRVVDFESDLFIARAIRDEPSIRRTDFPRNEAWHYPALGPDVYFVFVERRGTYEEGQPLDLIPRALQGGGLNVATSDRARLLGQTLRWIYKDLYPYSSDIRNRLLTLDSTVGGDGAAFRGNTALALQGEIDRARREDAETRAARDARIPPAASRVRPRPFGVARQSAIFLDGPLSDPTYAVWVGWSPLAAPLVVVADSLAEIGLSPERFVVSTTVVEYGPSYERAEVAETRRVLGTDGTGPRWAVAGGLPSDGHVAVEWDLYPATEAGDVLPPGAVAAEVHRVDTLDVAQAGVLRLSGVLSVDALAALAMREVERGEAFPPPQPAPALRSGEPLAVYYEVYTTTPGVTVEVEVRATKIRDGRILRPGQDISTASASRYVLNEPRRPELAIVEVGDLAGVDRVRVDVVVTDVEAAESVSQSVTFDLDERSR